MAAVLRATFFLLLMLATTSLPPRPPDFPFDSNPWSLFQNLTGCSPGDSNPILPDLKNYLHRFGYLPPPPSNFSDVFDVNLTGALLSYQHNLGLPVTGFLDPATLTLLSRPRCGVPDVVAENSTATRGRHLYSYFPGSPAWPADKRKLTYAITNTSSVSIDRPTLQAVFGRAFARWSAATTLNFTEVLPDSGNDADITIGFYSGDHGDGEPFDGVLGTLAHAFSPTDGRFHLDAAEDWVATGDVTAAAADNAVDLESVAVHEVGHLLGMGHTPAAEAVMYASIRTRTRKVELASDDVEGIQGLYGGNPSYIAGSRGSTNQETSGGEAEAAVRRMVAYTVAVAAVVF
ncbi:hypothetical protein KSP40_PGU012496 [Platanthera guangdongensis]|uniref:Peptidase metallopeptidase domain-containing protein n=1 Tax=Platanthera guangdongensis TaxID=2320717 RepID=A0ABR2MW40_9ASPA